MFKFVLLILLCFFMVSCSAPNVTTNTQETIETTAEPAEKTDKIPLDGLSNNTNGWGFRKIKGERPEFTTGQIEIMKKYGCIYMGDEKEKNIYLTFDEGYENGYTKSILDTLKEKNVKAAFFITSDYFEKNKDIVKRMIDEGHTVGNHTENHPSMPTKNNEDAEKEILNLHQALFDEFGVAMQFFRPPMGEYSERTLAIANNLGYKNVFWSFAYKDWEPKNQKGAEYALNQVMSGIHNGAVILLHAVSKDNADALPKIIDTLKKEGFSFKTLTEYI